MTVDHARILEALEAGESQNAIARRLGCSPGTVNRVARLNGVEYSTPKNAAAVRRDYAASERVALLNKVFARAEDMLAEAATPHRLQALVIALGILIDKRRLEDGDVTERTEVRDGGARERLASKLDELAARRRAAKAS